MRKIIFSMATLAAFSAPTIAMAQPVQTALTGAQVLTSLAKVRGVALSTSDMFAITNNGAAFMKSARFSAVANSLSLSAATLTALVNSANTTVSSELAVQALAQASDGQALTLASIQAFLSQHPELRNLTVRSFAAALNDPAVLQAINAIVAIATKPVTARGGGN